MTIHASAPVREWQGEARVPPATNAATPPPAERSVYASPAGGRIIAAVGTGLTYALMLAGFFLATFTYVARPDMSSPLTVFDVRVPASPPETPPQPDEAPRPTRQEQPPPEPQPTQPVAPPRIRIAPVRPPAPVAAPIPADPHPAESETAAPRTLPAPPAPQMASNAADTWEGRVLAQLVKSRRYPRSAQAWRQQGVPYVRIVMNREGKVLFSRLERSCGFPELDREAVALPKRASPLPKPPDDRPGQTLELVVPIEFLLKGAG
ncbi:MAG: energy transducer TonB [Sphingobium sp.]